MSGLRKLGLGTAQWGMDYGIANGTGRAPVDVLSSVLLEARKSGIEVLDTAALYGDAEAVLGGQSIERFRVVTKTPRFSTSTITDAQAAVLDESFQQSLKRLSVSSLYGLLLHHAADLLAPGGEKLWATMLRLKESGSVQAIGVSAYEGTVVDAILERFLPDIVQVPLNVFDQRMLLNGQLERMKARGIEVHARSAFLQGLLLLPLSKVPAYFEPMLPLLKRWHSAAQDQGLTPIQAALAFVRDVPYVDTVLIGIETLEQFRSCVVDFRMRSTFEAARLAFNDVSFLNPTNWKIRVG